MGDNFVCTILLTLTCQCRLSELARQALHWAAIRLAAADSSLVGKWRPVVGQRLLRRLGLLRLDTDPVVDGSPQLLLAPEVTLCGLDREMTEQKLDLIQFPAG